MKIAFFGKNYEKKGAEICIEKKFFQSIKDEIKFSKEYEIYKKHDELNESIDFN